MSRLSESDLSSRSVCHICGKSVYPGIPKCPHCGCPLGTNPVTFGSSIDSIHQNVTVPPKSYACICKRSAQTFSANENVTGAKEMISYGEVFFLNPSGMQSSKNKILIRRLDGQDAFVSEDIKYVRIHGARTKAVCSMYASARRDSREIQKLGRGSEIVIVDEFDSVDGGKFFEIRNDQGETGFIDSHAEVEPIADRYSAPAFDMILGFLLFVVGVGATCYSYMYATSKPRGGLYIIWWGPAIAGPIVFLKGFWRAATGVPQTILERMLRRIIQDKTQPGRVVT